MSLIEVAPAADPALSSRVHERMAGPVPLTLAELKKGLPKPPKRRGSPPVDLDAALRDLLADEVRAGRAFRHPSGRGGADRYWAQDERERVRATALAAAAEPKTIAELKKAGAGGLKADPGFIEGIVRELIGADELFEHPAKTKAGGPRFGVAPPPPPLPKLETGKFPKKVDDLAQKLAKLAAEAGVPTDDLFTALRLRLDGRPAAAAALPRGPVTPAVELDDLILKAVANAGPGSVLSLAELRQEMPAEYRGRAFDDAVLRLAEAGRVRVYQDGDPAALSDAERAEFVMDEFGHVFKTVAKRG